jgi:hypothetical protein
MEKPVGETETCMIMRVADARDTKPLKTLRENGTISYLTDPQLFTEHHVAEPTLRGAA